jgi:hypothetical protein
MNKLNLTKSIQNLYKMTLKNFSNKYEGIKGDVNWNGQTFLDGRPRINRYICNNSSKNTELELFPLDYSGIIKELENQARITYSRKKRSAGKVYDLYSEEKK